MMNKPPERIYLQCYDDQGEYLDPISGEVTWCVDQINETDAEYVLVYERRCDDCNCKLEAHVYELCVDCRKV